MYWIVRIVMKSGEHAENSWTIQPERLPTKDFMVVWPTKFLFSFILFQSLCNFSTLYQKKNVVLL